MNAANDAPVAVADQAATTIGKAVDVAVAANDGDIEGDTLTVTAVSAPAHGQVVILTGGVVRYTPDHGFSGEDTFTYTVADGNGGESTASVTVTVSRGGGGAGGKGRPNR